MSEGTDMNYNEKIEHLKYSVKAMLQERGRGAQETSSCAASAIWSEAMSILDYAINLSAENFLKIRFHTSFITGEPAFNFWHIYPPHDPEEYAESSNYKSYTTDLPEAYWIGDPPIPTAPNPIGVNYRGKIINQVISRYQNFISNLYFMGILPEFLEKNDNNIILEIGGGHGGVAHALGSILGGKSTYIILDLPETLLFSGGFLIANNPDKNIYIYEKSTFTPEFLSSGIGDYDYVLLPNYVLKELGALPEINLAINLWSFQEMTREQVTEYVDFAHSKLSGYIYSSNFDRHPYNDSLAPDTITSILNSRFELFPVPEFYEHQVKDYAYLSRFYFGVCKDKDIGFDEGASMRFPVVSEGKKVLVKCTPKTGSDLMRV